MKVKMYSSPLCPYCAMAKDFLNKHGVKFEDINVQEDQNAANEMIEKTGQNGVPVIDIDGQIIIGFNKEKLIEVLGLER